MKEPMTSEEIDTIVREVFHYTPTPNVCSLCDGTGVNKGMEPEADKTCGWCKGWPHD